MQSKKTNRKKWWWAVLIILAVSVAVIGNIYYMDRQSAKRNGKSSGDMAGLPDVLCRFDARSFSDQGMLYHDGQYIRYANAQTGDNDLICIDKNCRHDDKRNSDCGAYIDAGQVSGLAKRGKQIYYIAADRDTGDKSLYQANLQGKGRKKIADLITMDYISDVLYHQNMVYISYLEEPYEDQKPDIYGIYACDLKNGEGKQLFKLEGSGFALDGLAIVRNQLYFSYVCSNASNEEILKHSSDEKFILEHQERWLRAIDLKTGKESVAIEGYGSNMILPVCSEKIFYTNDDMNYYYDDKTKESVKFSDDNLIPIYAVSEKRAYFLGDGSDKTKVKYYCYDTEKGELQVLGESDFYPDAILSKKAYVRDIEGNYGILDTEDFLKGDYSKLKYFE